MWDIYIYIFFFKKTLFLFPLSFFLLRNKNLAPKIFTAHRSPASVCVKNSSASNDKCHKFFPGNNPPAPVIYSTRTLGERVTGDDHLGS